MIKERQNKAKLLTQHFKHVKEYTAYIRYERQNKNNRFVLHCSCPDFHRGYSAFNPRFPAWAPAAVVGQLGALRGQVGQNWNANDCPLQPVSKRIVKVIKNNYC